MAEHSENAQNEISHSLDDSTGLSVNKCDSLVCDMCAESFSLETLYRCLTCAYNESSDPKIADPVTYCDSCVVSHLRKKHEIVDYRGYSPLVCETHRKICEMFCNQCNKVFCLNCTMNHKKHDETVAEKAIKVRKAIFDLMGNLEGNSKGIKHREFVVTESSKHSEELSQSLSVDKLSATLSEHYVRVIQQNPEKLTKIIQDSPTCTSQTDVLSEKALDSSNGISALVARADKSMVDLKNLLQMSDGQSIELFMQTKQDYESVVQNESEEVSRHYYLTWELQLDEIVARSLKYALQLVKYPRLTQCASEKVILSRENLSVSQKNVCWESLEETDVFGNIATPYDDNAQLIDVTIGKEEISFKVFRKEADVSPVSFVSLFQVERNVISLPQINTVSKTHEWISFSGNKIVYFFSLNSSLKLRDPKKLPENCSIVAFSIITDSLDDCRFIQWNAMESLLYVQTWIGENVKKHCCDKNPEFVQHNSLDFFASVDEKSNLKLYNSVNGLSIEVSRLNHGLSKVDRIQKIDHKWLLMDYKMRIILVCVVDLSSKNISFAIEKVLQLEMPSSAPVEYCGFLDGFLYTYADSTFFATEFDLVF